MIIVGIGTNIGNRLANLREAVQYLSQLNTISIQAYAPIYASQAWLDPNAPKEWDQPFLNTAILCNTTLSPLDLLDALKSIEQNRCNQAGRFCSQPGFSQSNGNKIILKGRFNFSFCKITFRTDEDQLI